MKPIIQASSEGELVIIDKVRSEKRVTQYLIDKMQTACTEGVQHFYIMHGNILEEANKLRLLIIEKMPHAKVDIGEVRSVLAVHAGEDTLAVLWTDHH